MHIELQELLSQIAAAIKVKRHIPSNEDINAINFVHEILAIGRIQDIALYENTSLSNYFLNIANAIRLKLNIDYKINAQDFPEYILQIPSSLKTPTVFLCEVDEDGNEIIILNEPYLEFASVGYTDSNKDGIIDTIIIGI